MPNIHFPFMGLMISILICITFFTKKKVNTHETKSYSILLITGLLDSILSTSIIFLNYNFMDSVFIEVFNRLDLIVISLFMRTLFLYIFKITLINKEKLFKSLSLITLCLNLIFSFIALFGDLILINNDGIMSANGFAMTSFYIVLLLYWFSIIVVIFTNIKNINNKKYWPIYFLSILLIISLILRIIDPTLVLVSVIFAFSNLIMYHTIENPDLKLINELNMAKDAAERANKAKTDFLSSMSHEIRTPLNAIVGFSEMIENEDTKEGCKENAKYIIEASHTLLEIVNGILDISKIEANKMEIIEREYDFNKEIDKLVSIVKTRIGDKNLVLNSEIASDIPGSLYGDLGKVKQIITNVLTNAIKYTDEGEINFSVNCINQNDICNLKITVSDTGRGIKTEKIDNLFNKFDRLDEDKNTTIEGTGLGLAITKSLVELMNGKIIVQSEYGEGTIFTIFIKQNIVDINPTEILSNNEVKKVDFDGKRILIVDDNTLNLKITEKLLNSLKIDVVKANSGNECINILKNDKKFDLILMDDMMPELSGVETLKIIKTKYNIQIKTVALTANALEGMREKYLEDGFDDYLSKPIERVLMIDVLERLLTLNKYSNKKVLVIDDNTLNVKLLSKYLGEYGLSIDEAFSGQDGLDLFLRNKYDLAFIDFMMPGLNGIEVLQEMRKSNKNKVKAIVVTADSIDGSKEKFEEAGFDEYVAKPINKEIIENILNKYLK